MGLRPSPIDGHLSLALESGARSFAESSGSLGGLVTPTNLALGADEGLYLLDVADGDLKRFDACECRFLTVPCFGGLGVGARQLVGPAGITISRRNVWVTDPAAEVVKVFALRGYVLRHILGSPPEAGLARPWTPSAIASDRWGRVYIGDAANGCVHRFSADGRWQGSTRDLGAVRHIAIDRCGRLHVVTSVDSVDRVFVNGALCETLEHPDEASNHFPPLPFVVRPDGLLVLGDCGTFGLDGEALPTGSVPALAPARYARRAVLMTTALDSRLYQCEWHRVIVEGSVPLGCEVEIHTYTSEVLEPLEHVTALPRGAWHTRQVVRELAGEWDCLVNGDRGRYLWLRIEVRSTGRVTPTLKRVDVEFPRISLRRHLPAVYGEDPIGMDFTDRFLSIFDTTLRTVERQIDRQSEWFDPRSTPAQGERGAQDFLTWLGLWIGVDLTVFPSIEERRRFLAEASRLYDVRGTPHALRQLLLLYLGMIDQVELQQRLPASRDCAPSSPARCRPRPSNCSPPEAPRRWDRPPLVLEHFRLRRWLHVGAGRIGDQAVLWGRRIVNRSQLDAGARADSSQLISTQDPFRDPFHVYASKYTVFAPGCLSREPRRVQGLHRLLQAETPAHVHYTVEFVEPRFRVGTQSMIGFDAVVGRYPMGVALSDATGEESPREPRLGRDSVLAPPPGGDAQPTLRVGKRSQVGTTTRLD